MNRFLMATPSMQQCRKALASAKHVVFLTGAGISAESGIPTFRGAGGLWGTYAAQDLATWEAFERDPSLVWEFYNYRREVVSKSKPNPGHYAIAQFQQRMVSEGKRCTVITQNIDGLLQVAGCSPIEMHGSLWNIKVAAPPDRDSFKFCLEEGVVWEDRAHPICPALAGKGQPDAARLCGSVPVPDLPHRDGLLLRPAVVWFGEQLDRRTTATIHAALDTCDLLLVAGTSGVVYPAAGYAAQVARRNVPVAIVNLDPIDTADGVARWVFTGMGGTLLPQLLAPVTDGKELEAEEQVQ